jgi:UDP-glucose 4-epimerase
MNQILRGEPMTIFGDGTQIRAFTHIDDIAPIIASSVDVRAARNQVFNLGADEPYTINDLARIVAEEMGSKCEVIQLDPRNEVKVAFSDHSKAHQVFGRQSQTTLQMGIRAMAKWVKVHGARESSIFENIEVMKNLPPSWARVARKSVGGTL